MKCKTAYLIINPRLGKNVAKLTDMIAVFSAAGWKTDTALKEFGGHTMQLAREAAEAGYDLVIGYGGMAPSIRSSMASWRPSVAVVSSESFPAGPPMSGPTRSACRKTRSRPPSSSSTVRGARSTWGTSRWTSSTLARGTKDGRKKERLASGGRHHFLLMAGLGVDAAILRRVSTPLKEKIGEAAVALAAVKELPSQHAFPIEIRSSGAGKEEGVLWKGEALQVIVGNTRRYGNIAEVTPEAYIDDGVLDVCVITAGDPLTTIEQILSILLHRKPGNGRSEYFRGAHFWISVPASVDLQLDGSRVKLEDCLAAPDRTAHRQAKDPEAVMVTYRFDAMPRALRVAIPCTYDGALFEEGPGRGTEPWPPIRSTRIRTPFMLRPEGIREDTAPRR